MKITIYGAGCARCRRTEELVRETLAEAGIAAEIENVSELRDIATAGVMATPAVAVDGVMKVAGRIPTAGEILNWAGR